MSRRLVFDLPYFDAMESGEISLGVPVIDGAIQIGIPESEKLKVPEGILQVVVGKDQVLIAREEEEYLQFQVPVLNSTRVKALGEGAAELALGILGDGKFFVAENHFHKVASVCSLRVALGKVSRFASMKQVRNREATT